MSTLPVNGTWTVKHGLDFLAEIVNTRGMDFSRRNMARMAKKPVCLYNEDTDTDFGTVLAIVPISTGTSTTYYFITSENMFTWDATTSSLTELSTGSPPAWGLGSDAVVYLGLLAGSGTTNIKSLSGGTWTSRVTGRTSTNPHPLCVFENRNTLCSADGNTVYQTTTGTWSDDSTNRLVLPSEYVVTGMRWRGSNLYIATRAINGNHAKLFIWNGSGAQYQTAYEIGGDWIYSLEDFDDSICVLASTGQLLRFGGGGFTELAHFPVYDSPYSWATSSSLINVSGRCANRGMKAKGGRLYINIDGAINTSLGDGVGRFMPEQPSGLWCYDPEVGLYHKGGYSYTRYTSTTFTFGSSNFVFPAAHNLKTGDPIQFTDVTGLTGIDVNQMYYVVVVSSTTVKLAFSRAEALNGETVTVTGTPSGATAIYDSFESMGAVYTTTRPGAVGVFVTDNPPSILGGEVMYAGNVTKSDGTSNISTLMSLGSSHGISSFTTTPIPSTEATEMFQRVVQFLDGLYLDMDEVRVKWKAIPRYGFPTQYRKSSDGLAIWLSDSSFSIDPRYKDFVGAEDGDEVSIIEGAGAGYTAHISTIVDDVYPWVITLDESIPGITAGMKSEVIVDNWQKISTINNESEDTDKQFAKTNAPDISFPYMAFKFELRGIGVGVRRVESVSEPHEMLK